MSSTVTHGALLVCHSYSIHAQRAGSYLEVDHLGLETTDHDVTGRAVSTTSCTASRGPAEVVSVFRSVTVCDGTWTGGGVFGPSTGFPSVLDVSVARGTGPGGIASIGLNGVVGNALGG